MGADEVPVDDKAKRMRDLLSSFYSPDPSISSNSPNDTSSKHDDINSTSFDPDHYMNILVILFFSISFYQINHNLTLLKLILMDLRRYISPIWKGYSSSMLKWQLKSRISTLTFKCQSTRITTSSSAPLILSRGYYYHFINEYSFLHRFPFRYLLVFSNRMKSNISGMETNMEQLLEKVTVPLFLFQELYY